MQIVALIPWLDILLLLVFVGLVALCFWHGLLRELWLLLSLYLAAVLASLYGDYIAGLVGAQLPEVGPATTGGSASSALGFFVVFAVGVIVLFTILAALFARVRLGASLLWLDKVGGITLGLITAFVLTAFIAYLLQALLAGPGPLHEFAFFSILRQQRQTSPLLQAFLAAQPVILATLQPWLPGRLPAFLR